jgi:hypothetical protein
MIFFDAEVVGVLNVYERRNSPSTRSVCAYISEGECLEIGTSTLEDQRHCWNPESLCCNNALLSVSLCSLSVLVKRVVDIEVAAHNGFVESKARFELMVPLSILVDMSVRGFDLVEGGCDPGDF